MKTVTIYALHLGYGGVENYVINLANVLSEFNKVKIVSTYKTTPLPAFPLNTNVSVEYLINDKPEPESFKYAIKKRKIGDILRLSYHNIKILCLKKIKSIASIKNNDSDVLISTRSFHNLLIGKYSKKNQIKIATEHNYHDNNEKYLLTLRKSLVNFDFLIPISKYLTEDYQVMEFSPCKVLHLPFFVNFPKIDVEYERNGIIYIGRLEPEKGLDDLIKVFHKVLLKCNTCVLHIVGDGSQRKHLENMVRTLGISENVIFTGFLDQNQISKLGSTKKVLLMTSFKESFGIVLIEAMLNGIIPVAFDSALGAKEILDFENFLLVENRDISIMSEKVLKIMTEHDFGLVLRGKINNELINYSYDNMLQSYKMFFYSIFDEVKGKKYVK